MRNILIIDIETTGFQREGGAIVEVGAVSLDLDSGRVGTVVDQVCREPILSERHRVPPMGWIFDNSTLTVEAVRQAPLLADLRGDIQGAIDDHPLGATAYNRSFDFNFLESRGFTFGTKLPCPMEVATPICKLPPVRYGSHKWPKVEEAWQHFFPDQPYTELHRAADDAHHEALIVLELYRMGAFLIPTP